MTIYVSLEHSRIDEGMMRFGMANFRPTPLRWKLPHPGRCGGQGHVGSRLGAATEAAFSSAEEQRRHQRFSLPGQM